MGLIDDLKKLIESVESETAEDTSTEDAPVEEAPAEEAAVEEVSVDDRDSRIAELEAKEAQLRAIVGHYYKDVDAQIARVEDGKWRPAMQRVTQEQATDKRQPAEKQEDAKLDWREDPVAFMDAIDAGTIESVAKEA